MIRPAILAVALAVACTGFAFPGFADGDSNDPQMRMFMWDGGYFDKDGSHPKKNWQHYGNKAKDGMGKDGPMTNGQEKAPESGAKSGMAPGTK